MKVGKSGLLLIGAHLLLFLGVAVFWAMPVRTQVNCRMLIGGWHPDIQQEVILEHCQLPKKMT